MWPSAGRLPARRPRSRHSQVCAFFLSMPGEAHVTRRGTRVCLPLARCIRWALHVLSTHLSSNNAAGPLAAGQWQAAEGDAGLRAQLGELIDRFQQLTQSARDTASSLLASTMLLAAPPPSQNGGAAAPLPPASRAAAGAAAGAEPQRRRSMEAHTDLGVFELVSGSSGGAAPLWTRAPPPPLTLAELNTFFDSEGACVQLCLLAQGHREAGSAHARTCVGEAGQLLIAPPRATPACHTPAGRLANAAAFRQRVHAGGVEPEARPEAWKLLLGVHAPGSTRAERAAAAAERRRRYTALRVQWRSMDADQAARCSKWRERRVRIDKDVRRTGGWAGVCGCGGG